MLSFNAAEYVRICSALQAMRHAISTGPGSDLPADSRLVDKIITSGIGDSCMALDLRASCVHLLRIVESVQNGAWSYAQLGQALKELELRIADEMDARIYFALRPHQAKYYIAKHAFGEDVAAAFPSAVVNIEEAGKCLALDRATACVFHLMRVMESGLKAASKALGIPYAPSWESHLKQIDAQVQAKYKRKGVKWKRDEPFFRDVSAHLHSVKAAWRNPTMHVVRDYTPEQAEEIFNAVRAFMRHLSTRLSE